MPTLTPEVLDLQSPALGVSPVVDTPFFRQGTLVAETVLTRNEIILFGGPAGTGKTTTARHLAGRLQRPCATITVHDRPNPLDLLRLIHVAVTGEEHRGTGYEIRKAVVRALSEWGGVLIADEMQNCGVPGYKELVNLFESTGRRFAMVVVGSEVIEAVKQYPQLDTRVHATVRFKPLAGAELLDVVRRLDPRLQATESPVLAKHDQTTCRGLLRRWSTTVVWLDTLQVPPGTVDGATLADVTALMQGAE